MRRGFIWVIGLVPSGIMATGPVYRVFGLSAAVLFFIGCAVVCLFTYSLCIAAKQSDGEIDE